MNSNDRTIDYEDTSLRKYPYSKYYDYQQLNRVSKRVFDDRHLSKTIDHGCKKSSNRSKNKSVKTTKKSISSKGTSLSQTKIKNRSHNVSNFIQNSKNCSKQQIFEQLKHYKVLCLQLRKENQDLKNEISVSRTNNKQAILQLQQKVNKLNEKSLQIKQKQIKDQIKKANDQNTVKPLNKDKRSRQSKAREGQFKRFFLSFIEMTSRVDPHLQRKVQGQKDMNRKMVMGKQILRQSCDFLRDKKYQFKCIVD